MVFLTLASFLYFFGEYHSNLPNNILQNTRNVIVKVSLEDNPSILFILVKEETMHMNKHEHQRLSCQRAGQTHEDKHIRGNLSQSSSELN